jgi:hypothetical protein
MFYTNKVIRDGVKMEDSNKEYYSEYCDEDYGFDKKPEIQAKKSAANFFKDFLQNVVIFLLVIPLIAGILFAFALGTLVFIVTGNVDVFLMSFKVGASMGWLVGVPGFIFGCFRYFDDDLK